MGTLIEHLEKNYVGEVHAEFLSNSFNSIHTFEHSSIADIEILWGLRLHSSNKINGQCAVLINTPVYKPVLVALEVQ